jgi:hypothetical protein
MKFHTGIRCPLSEMQKCRNISERLHISLDDRLAKLVEEMDIVDGLADDNPSLAQNAPPDDDPELDPPVVDDITEDDLRMYDEMVQLAKSGEANVDLLDNDSMDMYNDDNAMSVDIDGENEEESHHLASSLKSDVSEDQRRSKTHTPVNPYQANFIPPISPPMGAASASAMPTFTHTYQTPSNHAVKSDFAAMTPHFNPGQGAISVANPYKPCAAVERGSNTLVTPVLLLPIKTEEVNKFDIAGVTDAELISATDQVGLPKSADQADQVASSAPRQGEQSVHSLSSSSANNVEEERRDTF